MDSQINFSVVVHGRMQDLPRGVNYFFFLGGGAKIATSGVAMRLLGGFGDMLPRKIFFEWCNLVRFGTYFHKFLTFKKSKNFIFIQK